MAFPCNIFRIHFFLFSVSSSSSSFSCCFRCVFLIRSSAAIILQKIFHFNYFQFNFRWAYKFSRFQCSVCMFFCHPVSVAYAIPSINVKHNNWRRTDWVTTDVGLTGWLCARFFLFCLMSFPFHWGCIFVVAFAHFAWIKSYFSHYVNVINAIILTIYRPFHTNCYVYISVFSFYSKLIDNPYENHPSENHLVVFFSYKVFQKWAHFCVDLYNTNEYAICPRKRILSRIKFLFFKKNSIHTNQSKHCLPLTHYIRAKRTTEPAARTSFCLVIVNKWLWKQTISLYI